jgi:hypothetical protein
MLLRGMKKLRLAVVALVAAIAVTVGVAAPALAAQPGEGTSWSQEQAGGSQIYARGITQARDSSGHLVEVWRGYDNNYIWISVDHQPARQWVSADQVVPQTYAAPQIVWTEWGFRVYHTGTDGNIYYAGLSLNGDQISILGGWVRIPNAYTRNDQPPAVTALPGGESVYLAWAGATGNGIWGSYFDGVHRIWDYPSQIDSTWTELAPAIAFSNQGGWNDIVLAYTDVLDRTVRVRYQRYGSPTWSGEYNLFGGSYTDQTPQIALTATGAGQIAIRRYQTDWIQLASIWSDRTWNGWSDESTYFTTPNPPELVANYDRIYLVAASVVHLYTWWKQSGYYGKGARTAAPEHVAIPLATGDGGHATATSGKPSGKISLHGPGRKLSPLTR